MFGIVVFIGVLFSRVFDLLADHDVIDAYEFELIEQVLLSALANCLHGNNGSHPKNNAQGSEEAPDLVVYQGSGSNFEIK